MNILSIDFDWIMEPSIEAYNHITHAESSMGCLEMWDVINKTIPGVSLECDLNKFNQLYFLLKDLSKIITKDNIYIGESHNEIYDWLTNKIQENDSIILYNIDHHHDLGYLAPKENDPITLANWVTQLNKRCNIEHYIWICNNNSCLPNKEFIANLKQYSNTNDINILNYIKFDKIFICASWEWVPVKYQTLFKILTSLIDDK